MSYAGVTLITSIPPQLLCGLQCVPRPLAGSSVNVVPVVPIGACLSAMAGEDYRFAMEATYTSMFPGGGRPKCSQQNMDGRAVPASELGSFSHAFGACEADVVRRIAQAAAAAAAAAVTNSALQAADGVSPASKRSRLSGVGVERRLSAVRASLAKAGPTWEAFLRTENKEVLKKGKQLKMLSDFIALLDKQVAELQDTSALDDDIPVLLQDMERKASLTNILLQIGTAMKNFYIRGNALQSQAEVQSFLDQIDKKEALQAHLVKCRDSDLHPPATPKLDFAPQDSATPCPSQASGCPNS